MSAGKNKFILVDYELFLPNVNKNVTLYWILHPLGKYMLNLNNNDTWKMSMVIVSIVALEPVLTLRQKLVR